MRAWLVVFGVCGSVVVHAQPITKPSEVDAAGSKKRVAPHSPANDDSGQTAKQRRDEKPGPKRSVAERESTARSRRDAIEADGAGGSRAARRDLVKPRDKAEVALAPKPTAGEVARRRKQSVAPAVFDDPCIEPGAGDACTRRALDAFASALAKQRARKQSRPLRIAMFGDSLIASDHVAQGLRDRLGAVVGDGGAGFVHAAPPHPYCQHRAATRVASGDWDVHGVSSSIAPDRLVGLGASAESTGGSIRLIPRTQVATGVDVHYLAQPRGGTLEVVADGRSIEKLSTAGKDKQSAFARIAIPAGTKKIDLRTTGRVRLFGAALEASAGVVVDNLGAVNATAKGMLRNNRAEHWQRQLAHRDADLVIVMIGANEAEWLRPKGAGIREHEKVFGELLANLRAGSPAASCLVLSPLDQLDWRLEGMPPRESVPAIVEAQRRAALAAGCAFWDTYEWMGGRGSSREWHRRGFVIKDYQHPTTTGSARIAEALFAGLAE
jgi:lysophospholipase L1-like esterase